MAGWQSGGMASNTLIFHAQYISIKLHAMGVAGTAAKVQEVVA